MFKSSALFLPLALCLLGSACKSDKDDPAPAPSAPSAPQLTAPAHVTSGKSASASVQSPIPSLTYTWTITGGTFGGGASTLAGSSVTFTAGSPGDLFLSCTAREGSGPSSSAGTADVQVLAAPDITAFSAHPTRIASGGSSHLNATFTGGTGVIDTSVGSITSDESKEVSPTQTTTYTLTVTNALGDTDTATVSVAVDITQPIFLPTGSFNAAGHHAATLLPSGLVLMTSGVASDNKRYAETYNPETGAFTLKAELLQTRVQHTATLLPSGKVLLTGGDETGYTDKTQSTTELYDPSQNTFTQGPLLSTIRFKHSATLLPNGKVLIAGGQHGMVQGFGYHASAELYDPTANTLTAVGSMTTPRAHHTATLLPNGKVLLAAGVNSDGATNTAELFDPETNTFSPAGSLNLARTGHTATLLPSEKVLVLGDVFESKSAELYDPNTNQFSSAGSSLIKRVYHRAVLLTNGKVLIAGGYYSPDYSYPAQCELYDPTSGTFTATASLATGRSDFSLTLLPDGRALVAGGSNGESLQSCELYEPFTYAP